MLSKETSVFSYRYPLIAGVFTNGNQNSYSYLNLITLPSYRPTGWHHEYVDEKLPDKRNLSRVTTTRNHRDSSPENEEAKQSENLSKLPDHLQSGHEAVLALFGQCEVVHHLAGRHESAIKNNSSNFDR
ncbi:hypothetical protein AVEN_190776-1 [Araneus ventricosus]|uniref:Uncharacterized protein n=1 Tax=Araneus ventricosus TaxID=182803 RepID=A0A4Y2L7G7_ARAVE|nr:hypothetical protein AVEN_190776-1 [Araneus ventricosus]